MVEIQTTASHLLESQFPKYAICLLSHAEKVVQPLAPCMALAQAPVRLARPCPQCGAAIWSRYGQRHSTIAGTMPRILRCVMFLPSSQQHPRHSTCRVDKASGRRTETDRIKWGLWDAKHYLRSHISEKRPTRSNIKQERSFSPEPSGNEATQPSEKIQLVHERTASLRVP